MGARTVQNEAMSLQHAGNRPLQIFCLCSNYRRCLQSLLHHRELRSRQQEKQHRPCCTEGDWRSKTTDLEKSKQRLLGTLSGDVRPCRSQSPFTPGTGKVFCKRETSLLLKTVSRRSEHDGQDWKAEGWSPCKGAGHKHRVTLFRTAQCKPGSPLTAGTNPRSGMYKGLHRLRQEKPT